MSLIVPAVLPTSQIDLEEKLDLFGTIPGVSRVQIDVVDGLFASPASWPYNESEEAMIHHMLVNMNRITYEIDLMCLDPLVAAEAWVKRGATRLTFHADSSQHLEALLKQARATFGKDIALGLAIQIQTDLEIIEKSIRHIDYLQCMGIARIGRQGQPLDPEVFKKIGACRLRYPSLLVQVDGGVTLSNARELFAAGASSLIAGSALLNSPDPAGTFEMLSGLHGV